MSTLAYYLNFSANPSLYAPTGLLVGSSQPDTLQLGPFDDFIDLTPSVLRHGHEGPAIATFEIGAWRIPLEQITDLTDWWPDAPAAGAARYSDVAISARIIPDEPDGTLGVFVELSTSHITEKTDQALADNLFEPPASASGLPRFVDGWPIVAYHGYGYFVRVPADLEEAESELRIPDDLRALLDHAHAKGARWLVLDRDGLTDPNLPTYDW